MNAELNFIQCRSAVAQFMNIITWTPDIRGETVFSQFRRNGWSWRIYLGELSSSFEDHGRIMSRRYKMRASRHAALFIMRREKRRSYFPSDRFIFFTSLHALRCPKFRPAAGKSTVDRRFSGATSFRRSIPVQTFAVRVLSVCAIDPFSLQVSWEGPRTGRYT